MNQIRLPQKATLEFQGGQIVEISERDLVRIYAAVSGYREKGGTDEGAALSGKILQRLGGSSEFERIRQLQIIRQLQQGWSGSRATAMIIGDSIRMRIANSTGYILHAYRGLLGIVNLVHVPHNCGGTLVGERHVDNWMSAKPDIVFYNAGLHDLAVFPNTDVKPNTFRDEARYVESLRKIFRTMKNNGVRSLLWGLNTPVVEEWHRYVPGKGRPRRIVRYNADIERYNEASAKVAREFGAPIVDMYSPIINAGPKECLLPDGVHLNHCGARLLGRIVADKVAKAAQEMSKDVQ